MKIVYLHQYFATPEMSGGTRSYEFARRLVRDGHEVYMITSDRDGGTRRTEDIEGIQVTWIPVKYSQGMGAFRRILSFLLFAILASIEGIKKKPTIVFATSTPLTIVFPALAIKWIRRVPMVFEVRDLWPEMPIAVCAIRNPVLIKAARWMEKLAYFQSRKVIALSPGMKDGIVATGYPADQVVVIPNSSDIDRFQIDPEEGQKWLSTQPWYRGGPIILYAGSLGELNDVASLVDIAEESLKREYKTEFVVIGKGKTRGAVESRASSAGVLGKNFHLLPSMPKQSIPLAYSAATVSLSLFRDLKPMERNSANKFFDALAAGRPIAINYGGWHQNLLDEHSCGMRVSRTPSIASVQLNDFVTKVRSSPEIGINAQRLAREEFDRDKLYVEFVQVLCQAVASAKWTQSSTLQT